MASNITSYFAWVDQTDATWNSSFARNDEAVFSFDLSCEEGQIPRLMVEIINPRVGLLGPGRHYWCWFTLSPDGGSTFVPAFFGRLLGIPQTILFTTTKLEFVARAPDYIRQKQLVAESLKVLPSYDPIFFDVQKRDDPDAILEGYSSLYAVDRVTGAVSASDILIGEDGTLNISPDDTFYDSVQMKLEQSPLVAVNVKAEVTWEQQFTGYFNVGQWSYPSLGNEPFVNDWPKSGQALGGGYTGAIAWAGIRDPHLQINQTSNINYQYHWQNGARQHIIGDTMQVDVSYSIPPGLQLIVTDKFIQGGQVNPYTTDALGYPDPTNIPAIERLSYFGIATFALDFAGIQANAVMNLRYDANRKRSEQIEVTVTADVQPILVDPLITEDTETISIKSGDLALPTIDLLNWSSVAGLPVSLGQLIFPDNPLVAGQTSIQIAISAGTAGTVEPVFSNIAGVTTNDGSVVWSSLGSTQPVETSQDWVQSSRVSLGTLLIPRPIMGAPDLAAYIAPGQLGAPPLGVPSSKYTIIASGLGRPGDTMLEVTAAGVFGGTTAVQATTQSFINPSGQTLYVAIQAGMTGQFHTTFNDTPGATTTDGTVVWQAVGLITVPIGGWPGSTPASNYFPTARGQLSLQHLICRAVAKLRRRARAVQVTFQCQFLAAISISCRMNVSMEDPRLPGGTAAGKVISYKLKMDGDTGVAYAEITIGCSIGNNNAVVPTLPGTAVYVDGVFNQGDVEVWAGQVSQVLGVPTNIGYTPPVQGVVDDGLSFPLTGVGDVLLTSLWHGVAATVNKANINNYNAQIQAATTAGISSAKVTTFTNGSISGGFTPTYNPAAIAAVNAAVFQGTSLWYELSLKNLNGGPYSAAYVVDTTLLEMPKTIDLSAT